jgi:hypothetical protein
MKKCPRGMFAEIKYDGERIQIHKKGDEYAFFSRNLKKILEWKVAAVRDYITEVLRDPRPHLAHPEEQIVFNQKSSSLLPLQSTEAETIILDGEILLMDTKTSKPLPFGSLGTPSSFDNKRVILGNDVCDDDDNNNDQPSTRKTISRTPRCACSCSTFSTSTARSS